MEVKSLHNTDINGAKKNVKDIKVFGNGDLFTLISKASSENEGWMKSTKAMFVGTGCLVQVTTQQRNPDGSYAVAEALTYVPGVEIVETGTDEAGVVTGRKLAPIGLCNEAPQEMSMAEFVAKAKSYVESDADKDFTEKKPSAFPGVTFVKE